MSEMPKIIITMDPDDRAAIDRLTVALDEWRWALEQFASACVVAGQAIGSMTQAMRDADEARNAQ